MVVHGSEPYNAEPPPGALLGQVTPLDTFYSRNHGPIPRMDVASWRLRVDGLVDRPLELSMDELRRRFPERKVVATPMPAVEPPKSAAASGATGRCRLRAHLPPD